jgi:anaphase-promoting complex subunit 2
LIAVYIRTIKALRTLDPSGVLLQQSTQEVKAYMRDRADTLRTIVGLVTAEGEDSLMEELEANEAPIMIEGADDVYESEDEDNDSFLKWNPKPTTAQPDGPKSL